MQQPIRPSQVHIDSIVHEHLVMATNITIKNQELLVLTPFKHEAIKKEWVTYAKVDKDSLRLTVPDSLSSPFYDISTYAIFALAIFVRQFVVHKP